MRTWRNISTLPLSRTWSWMSLVSLHLPVFSPLTPSLYRASLVLYVSPLFCPFRLLFFLLPLLPSFPPSILCASLSFLLSLSLSLSIASLPARFPSSSLHHLPSHTLPLPRQDRLHTQVCRRRILGALSRHRLRERNHCSRTGGAALLLLLLLLLPSPSSCSSS